MFAVEKGAAFDILGTFGSRQAVTTTAGVTAPMAIGSTARRLMVEVYYDANATPGGILELVPKLCMDAVLSAPDPLADRWTIPGIWDGTVTVGNGITPVAGSDWTVTPGFGRVIHDPVALRTRVTTGVSDKIRTHFSINVEGHRWFALQYAEAGAANGAVWLRGSFYS
jgi:hypothetical protein